MPKGVYPHKKGSKSHKWKGNNLTYSGIHQWVNKTLGKPKICQKCGTTKTPKGKKLFFQWANISGHYLRIVEDWKRLCATCHRKFDDALYNKQLRKDNTSGIAGVTWDKTRNKWKILKSIKGKIVLQKRFQTKEEAALAVANYKP